MVRSRAWIFTINNYSEEEYKGLNEVDAVYIIAGKEIGEQCGTPHLQGYVYFRTLKSHVQLAVMFPRARTVPANGSAEKNKIYCTKEGRGHFEKGIMPTGKKPSKDPTETSERNMEILNTPLVTLVEEGIISIYSVPTIVKAKMAIAQQNDPYNHDGVRGVWYYGPPGTGKSRKARDENPSYYLKAQNKWFDGYAGQDCIILDDLDTKVLGHYLKIWSDRYACSGEIKGGTINLVHKKFIVTSNYSIEDLFLEDEAMATAIRRRFDVVHFN